MVYRINCKLLDLLFTAPIQLSSLISRQTKPPENSILSHSVLSTVNVLCPILSVKVPIVSPKPSSKVTSSLKPSLLPQVFSSHCSQKVSNFGCIRELLKYTVIHPFKYLTTCGYPELFQGRKSLCIFNYC